MNTKIYLFLYIQIFILYCAIYNVIMKIQAIVASCFCQAYAPSDSKNRSCLCSLLIVASLICGAYFIGNAFTEKEYIEVCLSVTTAR